MATTFEAGGRAHSAAELADEGRHRGVQAGADGAGRRAGVEVVEHGREQRRQPHHGRRWARVRPGGVELDPLAGAEARRAGGGLQAPVHAYGYGSPPAAERISSSIAAWPS